MNESYIRNIKTLFDDASKQYKSPSSSKSVSVDIKIQQKHIDILQSFEDAKFSICTEISRANNSVDIQQLSVGDNVTLNFSPHYMRTNIDFYFYFTFDEFLKENNVKTPANFLILEKSLTNLSKSDSLDIYEKVVSFQNLLTDISDDVETDLNNKIYTFFDTKKIKINSSFEENDIKFILQNCQNFGINIKKLYDDLEFENQKQIRIIFFKKALEITFKKSDLTMSDVLHNINDILQEYEAHYRAYINSLEPEKIKAEFEEEHNRFLKELNSILADVHNKVIFIPIAFIFGATQFTTGSTLKGVMIIAGMMIFSTFISLFLHTHSRVLAILDDDISSKKKFFEKENPSLFKKYQNKLTSIEKLSKSIKTRITITNYTTWLLVIIAILIFCSIKNICC